MVVLKIRWLKKGIATQRPREAPTNYQIKDYDTKRYVARDFSIAKIKRTNFLAAWERATL